MVYAGVKDDMLAITVGLGSQEIKLEKTRMCLLPIFGEPTGAFSTLITDNIEM
jgi:hypothetical protein